MLGNVAFAVDSKIFIGIHATISNSHIIQFLANNLNTPNNYFISFMDVKHMQWNGFSLVKSKFKTFHYVCFADWLRVETTALCNDFISAHMLNEGVDSFWSKTIIIFERANWDNLKMKIKSYTRGTLEIVQKVASWMNEMFTELNSRHHHFAMA